MRFRPIPLSPLATLAVAILVAVAGCARSVELNTDPGQSYAVNVINTRSQPMVVSFDDGDGTRLLGTVGANRTERFVVAGSSSPTVSIVAEDEGRTFTVRRTVVLRVGETVDVRL
ncbi:MAG TPA: hypothetical protein VK966_07845 [Longimicrobiales bacterium]|nr:hypothetical protein [Longimicrobiales bacterium]